MQIEKSFRGISERLAKHYLQNLGGEPGGDEATIVASDWTAHVSSEKVSIGPSLELTEVTVVFSGDESILDELVERFSQKAMRAGG
ncbi:hypothetical protein [Haladaptatus sp. DJG-WS-42]|uniref:hypothetical protein n=1 Tax=Haladaptatus sp. DJG-WS-42 TaxID=3120516 RepID=UPI0030D4DDEF